MWNSPVAGSATKGLAEEPSRCTRLPSSCRAQTSTCWLAATSEAWDFPSLFSITASPERQKFRWLVNWHLYGLSLVLTHQCKKDVNTILQWFSTREEFLTSKNFMVSSWWRNWPIQTLGILIFIQFLKVRNTILKYVGDKLFFHPEMLLGSRCFHCYFLLLFP